MSTPGGYSVDLTHLDETTARIRAFTGFVSVHLASLDEMAKTLSATWSSEAATAYGLAHREWSTGAQEVRDGLDALESAARTAHSNYQGAIAANLRMLGR
ncbi:WXG100 family type VII secretion target [Nocardia sp. NBC_01503]|uniref:WXG100 family type VII secretion target n=1 Tax=Nocardia sp. NBC_01503 TaxID=2975997 RepID=UPI002E7C195B|nr:WXG100 family type VII secretion target [Nocardia sp. NBC_01503]WTL32289.1 WXG100 family type VII secretion target [Nocardia sp. NBC_01503]